MSNETALTINGQEAAVIHDGLGKAVMLVEDLLKLKSSGPYKGALTMQIAAFRNVQGRLAATFPSLIEADAIPAK
jgi:hypothetical protein